MKVIDVHAHVLSDETIGLLQKEAPRICAATRICSALISAPEVLDRENMKEIGECVIVWPLRSHRSKGLG